MFQEKEYLNAIFILLRFVSLCYSNEMCTERLGLVIVLRQNTNRHQVVSHGVFIKFHLIFNIKYSLICN